MNWVLVIAVTLISVLFVLLSKYYQLNGDNLFLLAGIAVGALMFIGYAKLFDAGGVAFGYSTTKVASIVIIAIIGIYLFSEKLSIIQWFGIFLACVAIYLLSQD